MKAAFRYLILHPLAFLLVVAFVLLSLGVALLFTNTGTQLLFKQLKQRVPSVQLEGVTGTIGEGLGIERLRWLHDKGFVALDNIKIKPALNFDTLRLAKVEIEHCLIHINKSEIGPVNIPTIQLPLNVEVSEVQIGEFRYSVADNEIVLENAQLAAHTKDGVLFLDSLNAMPLLAGKKLKAIGSGQMALAEPHALQAQLEVTSLDKNLGFGEVRAKATGSWTEYKVTATGDWQYQRYPKYALNLTSSGNPEQWDIDALVLRDFNNPQSSQNSAYLTGYVNWYDAFCGNWVANLAISTPSIFKPMPQKGPLNTEVQAYGREAQSVKLVLDNLTGTLLRLSSTSTWQG